jgi:hypothetical protein
MKRVRSQETSFQRSSLLDFGTMEPIKRKEVSSWPLIYIRARELLLLCLVTELVILWKSTIGKKWVGSDLDALRIELGS